MAEATVQELRALYEKSRKLLTRRKKTAHRLRMAYRRAIKRRKQRAAITARKKRAWLRAKDGGRERAVEWALSKVGVHETPGRPNEGPQIDTWNRAVSLPPGPYAYWCGSFVHAALKAGGLDFPDWIRYTPSIYTYAQQRKYGLSLVTADKAQPGDLILYDFDGGGIDHVGLYIGQGETVEGNTSPGTGGSQNNGGGVYKRTPRGRYYYVHIDYSKAPKKVKGEEKH